jgi:hypothetical protein
VIYIKKIKKDVKKPASTWESFQSSLAYMTCTLGLAMVALFSQEHFPELAPVRKWANQCDRVLVQSGLLPKSGVVLEAFIAMVCWSMSYIFIRRLLNPETSRSTFEKYSADSFFGGLAAAASVLLKSVVTAALAEK